MKVLDRYRMALETRSVLSFALLCALFSYPVIAADIMHRDDVWRVISGQYAWAQHGRPLAELVTAVFTLSGSAIIDIAPFSQLAFALCLLASFAFVRSYFQREYKQDLGLPLAVLFLNPFFLGNILYQYDAMGMGLAIVITAAAFSLTPRFQASHFAISVIAFVIVLALYQPTLNLLIGLCAVQLAASALDRPRASTLLRLVGYRASQFIAAYVVYYAVIGLQLHDVSDRSSIVSLDADGLRAAIGNAGQFISFVGQFFRSESMSFVVLFVVFAGLGGASIVLAMCGSTHKSGFLIGALLSGLVSVLSFFGPLIIIEDMLVAYRTIPSAFAPLAVLAVFIARSRSLWPVICLPLFASVVLSFQTMAAYKNQRSFDKFIAGLVAADLNDLNMLNAPVFTFGVVPTAPQAKLARQLHPMISDLAAPAKHWIFEGLLIQHGMQNTQTLWTGERPLLEARFEGFPCDEITTRIDSNLYRIVEAEGAFFVILSEAPDFGCIGSSSGT